MKVAFSDACTQSPLSRAPCMPPLTERVPVSSRSFSTLNTFWYSVLFISPAASVTFTLTSQSSSSGKLQLKSSWKFM